MTERWYVYILVCGDGTLYTGSTNNLKRRLKEHEDGKGAKYTRGRGPLVMHSWCEFDGRSSAQAVEARIKRMSSREKLEAFTSHREWPGESDISKCAKCGADMRQSFTRPGEYVCRHGCS